MLKIKQRRGRAWARLSLRMCFVMAYFYLMFGVLFGVKIGKGNSDGSIVMFCRVCSDYAAGDLLIMRDGELMKYGDNDNSEMVAGKVIASLRIRGFYYEDN